MGCCRIWSRIERLRGLCADAGQTTVEAAVLLPTLLTLLAMLVQPVCMGYTRAIMTHAACETARVLATTDNDESARAFALRRLAAVPEASLFHVGGTRDWDVSFAGGHGAGTAEVTICGHVRPLPFFGALVGALGERDARGVVLRARVVEDVRPEWLGGDYASWQELWD